MAYFIFSKNSDDQPHTIYKIAQDENDLMNLNIVQTNYKIIEDSLENFNAVKFGKSFPLKYSQNNITYISQDDRVFNKDVLKLLIQNSKQTVKAFLDNNLQHPYYSKFKNYFDELTNLNVDNINYPLDMSLEKYIDSLGKPSFNILQVP